MISISSGAGQLSTSGIYDSSWLYMQTMENTISRKRHNWNFSNSSSSGHDYSNLEIIHLKDPKLYVYLVSFVVERVEYTVE
ncbi:hypothetical protein GDO81_006224 [Engystomops pustulosus]|uniref:Uncharacterized protein n=1 Tax=Engystomops pustulosus TaxID=76066 RepID=A0AAV7CVC0_ENGPU|nr:hypothetical protein GDO81_006224 [Engystomops pustulosus]